MTTRQTETAEAFTVAETGSEGLRRSYCLTIAAAEIDRRVEAAVAELAPRVRMPGFRPGRVPGNLIRRMHGPALRAEAVEKLVSEGVRQLMADRGLRPAMEPQVELEGEPAAGSDLRVRIALEVLPEVPEVEIAGIPLEKLVVAPDEAEVESALAGLAAQQKRFIPAPPGHAAAPGDLVVIDFEGRIDGAPFEGGRGTGLEVELGSGRLIPGFEAQLAGASAGEARTVRLSIPADHPDAAIAGKEAVFAVTVADVRVPEIPPVDDSLATNLGLSSLAELRGVLRDRIAGELASLTRTHMKRKLLDHLAAACRFEVPPSMVEAEFQQIWRQVTEGADADALAQAEAERADYRRIAERRVRLGLLLSDIGRRHGVTISQAEMQRLIAEEAARYPGQEAEVRRHFAENPMAAAQLRAPLFEEKVVDFLLAQAVVTERPATRAELEAAIASEDETPLAEARAGSFAAGGGGDAPAGRRPARARRGAPADPGRAEAESGPAVGETAAGGGAGDAGAAPSGPAAA